MTGEFHQDARRSLRHGLQWSILSRPPGPIAAAFVQDVSPMTFIMGPVGSAKTTSCVAKCLNIARLQPPSILDGKRKARVCVVRTTYGKLWESTIPSYWKAFPKHLGKWNGGRGEPATHVLEFSDPRFGQIHFEILFRAISEQNIEDFVAGFEVTAWYLNEADHLPADCLGHFWKRAGRAFLDERPRGDDGKPVKTVRCVFGDFNAPEEDNWLWKRCLEERPGDRFYIQPSGFSPDAENLHNLGDDWYAEQAAHMEDWEVKRFIENKVGFSRSGQPVYPQYSPDKHDVSDRFRADPRADLVIGVDGGGTAAAVICQRAENDRLVVLDEIVTPEDQRTDGYTFGKRVAGFLSAPVNEYRRFLDQGRFVIIGDPANFKGGQESGLTFMEAFRSGFEEESRARCRLLPAETNAPEARQAAVRRPLSDMADGRPRLLVNKRCAKLRRGFISGYKLRKAKTAAGDIVFQPVKNEFSHVHDALQYAALHVVGVTSRPGVGGHFHGAAGRLQQARRPRVKSSAHF